MDSTDTDDRDTLSESHKDYMIRFVQYELQRQERVSQRFLKERASRMEPSSLKMAVRASSEVLGLSGDVLATVTSKEKGR
jgi:hypothetical protein